MRVSELARELGKTSKEILEMLQKNHVSDKTHSSNISEEHIQMVKRILSPAAHAPAPAHAPGPAPEPSAPAGGERGSAEAPAEPPRKKITAVYRPQNAQTMRQRPLQGGHPGAQGRPQAPGGRPQNAQGVAPARHQGQGAPTLRPVSAPSQPAQSIHPQGIGVSENQAQMSQGTSAQGGSSQAQPVLPASSRNLQGQSQAAPQGQAQAQGAQGSEPSVPAQPKRAEGSQETGRPQQGGVQSREGSREGNRPQGERDGNRQGSRDGNRLQGERDGSRQGVRDGNRPQGERDGNRQGAHDGNRPQGERDGNRQGAHDGNRPQGERDGNRQGAQDGNRPQGERDGNRQGVQDGNRSQGERDGNRQGVRDGNRPQGERDGNRQGSRDGNRQGGGGFSGSRDGNRQGSEGFSGGRDGNRQGGSGFLGSRDGNRQGGSGFSGGRDGGRQGSGGFSGGRDGGRQGSEGFSGGRDGSRQGGGGILGSRDGNRQGGSGFSGGRDGSRQGGSGFSGGRDGNRQGGSGFSGGRDGGRQGGSGFSGGRDGSRQGGSGFSGGRDGSRQGGSDFSGGRDGGRQGGISGNRPQGGRAGQKDLSKSFDTPIATKPQSNRANKNAYKNDKYDKKNMTEDGPRTKGKVSKHPFIMPQKMMQEKVEEIVKVITIPEVLTIKDLAEKMKLQPSAIIKKLFMKGTILNLNQEIDYEKAEEIAMEYDVLCEKAEKIDVIEELLREDTEREDDMVARPPVVCVMGHVDHGKTSLLDAIRQTNVTAKEAGGITQHIGAYVVEINGEKITFLDTPGHEAFTAMRMRGAQSTDIAVLVVAADDGVMPQTVEAINHAKAAGVEIIVAINKIDKPSANVERVKQELSEHELIPEDWGGSTIFVPVSAHTKEGISDLLEMIILASEVKELKANPNRNARGLVIEAELDKGKGPVATVLVQKGTLQVGDNIAAGSCYGKVRAMMDDKGRRVKEATPSMPVEILGLNGVPNAGEVFVVTASEKEARSFADTFISEGKNKLLEDTKAKLSLDDLFSQIKAGNVKELPIIVKADVQGSVEAVKQSLLKLSNEEVMVKVIHGGVGAINESDVALASASNAIIIGFNVRPDVTAKSVADQEKVDLRLYKVIYQAIEDVEAAMKGMLDPVFEEKIIGHAVVRQIFRASGVGAIAGSYVMDGKFQRGCSVRITRDGGQIYEGALASLRRFKDDVKEVATGYECGLVFDKWNDLQEDDMIEAYVMVEVPR